MKTGINLIPFSPNRLIIVTFCIYLAATGVVRVAEAREDWPRVVDIEVRGLTVMTQFEFLGKVSVRPGDLLTPERISMLGDDIRRLLQEEGIRFEIQQVNVPDGVVLVFNVLDERIPRTVTRIRYKGAPPAWFRDVVRIRPGDEYSQIAVAADIRRIQQILREKGHMLGTATHSVREVAPGQVRVTFKIERGPRFQLQRLIFVGNEAFSDSRLKRFMRTKVDTFFTSRHFDPDQWERDMLVLNQFYIMQGYRNAVVSPEPLKIDYQNGIVEAVVHIIEGPRFRIASITFEGNQEIDDSSLMNVIKHEPGDFYSYETIRADMEAIYTYYTTEGRGYAMVSIDPEVSPAIEPDEIELTYRIMEGRPTVVRRIETSGNFITRRKVIVREMRVEPGDVFDSEKMIESRRRLRDLRYFETIDFRQDLVPPPDIGAMPGMDYMDITVDVVEQPTGSLMAGIGFSTDAQFTGQFAIEQRNFDISNLPDFQRYGLLGALSPSRAFVGGGQRLRLVAEPGTVRSRYFFDFEDPWFLDYPVEFSLSGYYFQRFFEGYTLQRAGGTIGLGKRYGRDLAISGRYRLEGIRVFDLDQDSPIDAVDVEGTHRVASYLASIRYDTRDSVIFPTSGGFYRAWGELGGQPAGGNVGFWKQGLEGTIYQALYDFPRGITHVIRIGAETSFAGPAFGDDDVPIFERLFAGGIGSFRGFRFHGIGPRQTDPPTGDTALGGRFLFLGALEYIIPLYNEDYQMYIFSDVGTLSERVSADAFDRLRVTTGVGFRLFLPMLGRIPLTFNFATPLQKEPEDKTEFFSFSLGIFF